MDGPSSDRHQLNSLLRLYPPARALHHALPNAPRPTSLLRRCTRRKQRAARRIDVLERIGPRDVPWQANGGRSEQRRAEPSAALLRLGPHHLEPAQSCDSEQLHRKVPVRHGPSTFR